MPARVSPGLIAGAVVGGIVGIALLVTIVVFLRRISCLKRRRARYEKLSRNATHTYWSWRSSPGKLTPFGSNPLSETKPPNDTLRPFSVSYTPYAPEVSEPPELTNETSLSGFTIRGDTAADKTQTRESRESTHTGYTSLSGYTTHGGTSAEKTVSSSTSNQSQIATSSNLTPTGNTSSSPRHSVQSATKAGHPSSRPSSGTSAGAETRRKAPPSLKNANASSPSNGVSTSRVVAEGEEIPPAYSTNILS